MRYLVGIDLGTTNTAVSYAAVEDGAVRDLDLAQLVGPGEVAGLPLLPSFLLLPTAMEVTPEQMAMPWDPRPGWAVGAFARDRGAELPHRVVASAKSWLCHTGVDRRAPILPWRGDAAVEGGERVSPLEASARILRQVAAGFADATGAPLAEQEVLLAVPASFDAVARELTVEAARLAGLPEVILIEEPQAAFYAWLAARGDTWRGELRAGEVVLVCDIGGGTTDFTLIEVVDRGGNLELERIAVGDHILLGGDNIDLALGHAVAAKLATAGKKVDAMQLRALVHACRRAKEQLLSDDPPDAVPITVLGRSSKLIGGSLKSELRRDEAEALVLDGFFPRVGADARPEKRRAVGLRELGLPYAADPAVTRHLAELLARHGRAPTAVLWNGGVMNGALIRDRVLFTLDSWFGAGVRELAAPDLDRAVARGAAYYGLVRRGRGIRIRGGTARSYYIGVEAAMPAIPGFAPPINALCVAPFGMEEGSTAALPDEELGLVVGESAEFRFFASSARKQDRPGDVVDPAEVELAELDPVETRLAADEGAAGEVVPVSLESRVTEVGTLELWCRSRRDGRRWKLEYSLRHGAD
ncbi:MAG TPA: Hsp70 family protein [Kofleriaceae bacterium]|nr:Hsp70 family protein [Kofleriaceae bacterium]